MADSPVSSTRLLTRAKGRDKPQLSCDFCRKRKLRCDRKQPCQSCIRFGRASACNFPFFQSSNTSGDQTVFQQRIHHLETLVRTLAQKQQEKTPSLTHEGITPPETSIAAEEDHTPTPRFGSIRLQKESSYVESDHWKAILDEISDLRNMAGEEAEQPDDVNDDEPQRLPGADLFFLQTYSPTKLEILADIPARLVLDNIIARYFQTADMPVTLTIHRTVFFKQYEEFWEDPASTPTLWLTIVFGMMYMVTYYELFLNKGKNIVDDSLWREYDRIYSTSREKMIHCLRLGNYMKGTPHTIEALLMFLQTEFVEAREDAQQGIWQLIGTIVRVALKMGYHRDGSHFPNMSPFEAEMRRRTWYILMQFDIASASQVGLPRAIKETQCDTAEPRNLLDEDFDDSSTILPPGRPPNEHTLSQFLIHKSRVVMVYGMICDFTTSSKQRDYTEAMRLDGLLRKAYDKKPPVLEIKPVSRSIMDSANLITRRVYITMSYYHAQMTLHRKFMILAKSNKKYTASHTTCVDAARSALQLQVEISEHTQPGRMLYNDRWKIFAFLQSEFLLATIILCYNLDDDISNARLGRSPLSTREAVVISKEALRAARKVWREMRGMSQEARAAVNAIDQVFTKAEDMTTTNEPYIVSSLTLSTTHTEEFHDGTPEANYSEESWNEFFDLDRSWDAWLSPP